MSAPIVSSVQHQAAPRRRALLRSWLLLVLALLGALAALWLGVVESTQHASAGDALVKSGSAQTLVTRECG